MKEQKYTHAVLVHRLMRYTRGSAQSGGSSYSLLKEHKHAPQAVHAGASVPMHCQDQACQSTFTFRLFTAAERKAKYLAKLKEKLVMFGVGYLGIVLGAMLGFNGPDIIVIRGIGFLVFYLGAIVSVLVLLSIIFGRTPKYDLEQTSGQSPLGTPGLMFQHKVELRKKA